MEKELLVGFIVLGMGVSLGSYIVYEWIAAGYGSIFKIEYAIISMVFIAIGIQVIFGAIFMSMMLLETNIDR
jgi:predicted MFS family arabinose efflux permease